MANQRMPAELRRRQIAEAALEILGSKGARALTAGALARAVGTTDAALFRHFESMTKIVDAAIEIFADELGRGMTEADGDPMDRLHRFFVARLTRWHVRPELLRLLTSDRLADAAGAAGAGRVGALRDQSQAYVVRCLADAQAAGQIARDLPLEVLWWMVRGALIGSVDQDRTRAVDEPQSPTEPERIWQCVEAILRRSARRERASS